MEVFHRLRSDLAGIAHFCGKPHSGGRFWLTNHAGDSFASRGEDRLLEKVLVAEVSL